MKPKSKRDLLYGRKPKYPPVLSIEEYEKSKHVTRHNTICYNVDEAYAIEIFELEQKELDPTVNDTSAGWRRQEIVQKINDIEYLLPYLKDPDGRVGINILKKMPVKKYIDTYTKIIKDDSYPREVRIYAKDKLNRVKKSVRFILEM